jgi:hypothetical protein
MNRSYIIEQIRRYQNIFRLEDWDITVKIKRGITSKYAETFTDSDHKRATIIFYPDVKDGIIEFSWDRVVRHELFHIILTDIRDLMHTAKDKNEIGEAYFILYQKLEEVVCGNAERFKISNR